eukprot:5843465-Pleurochrysis_carterae.AAC.3
MIDALSGFFGSARKMFGRQARTLGRRLPRLRRSQLANSARTRLARPIAITSFNWDLHDPARPKQSLGGQEPQCSEMLIAVLALATH